MASIVSTQLGDKQPVLLLGGGGQLGRVLRAHWPEKGDLRVQSSESGVDVLQFDLMADASALRDAAKDVRAVICLAGITNARAAQTGEPLALNTDLALAAVAASSGARVFLASSAAVYGAENGLHFETDHVHPVSPYGIAKRDMETQAIAKGIQSGVAVTSLRIANVAGADAILGGWREGMQIDQFDDGTTPRRSYIGPVTLSRVIHALTLIKDLPDVINIAAPGTVAMGDLLDAAHLQWTPRAAADGAIRQVALDVTRLSRYVDFAPHDSTPAGLVAEWNET